MKSGLSGMLTKIRNECKQKKNRKLLDIHSLKIHKETILGLLHDEFQIGRVFNNGVNKLEFSQ